MKQLGRDNREFLKQLEGIAFSLSAKVQAKGVAQSLLNFQSSVAC